MFEKKIWPVWATSGYLMEAPTLFDTFLFALDILGQKLFCLNKFNGQRREFDLTVQITSLACPDWRWQPLIQRVLTNEDRGDGTVLIGTGPRGLCVLHVGVQSVEVIEVTQIQLPKTVRFNDGKMSPDGIFYAGTMDKSELDTIGSLYRFLPDGGVECIVDGIVILNGPCFNDDGTRMLYADSAKGIVYDMIQSDGGDWQLHGHFVEISPEVGAPDGMTFDPNDCVWIAVWGSGAVFQFDSSGTFLRHIDVGLKLVTSVCLDPEAGHLYVTGQNDLNGTGALKCIRL